MKKVIGLLLGLSVITISATTSYAVELEFERDPSVPMVNLSIVILGGSVTDPADLSGLTSFMGELMLRGTLNRSQGAVNLALDQMGAKLEVDTRLEATTFRGSVLSRELKPYLALVEEILTRPSFQAAELAKLKSKTLSEIAAVLDDDATLARRESRRLLFGSHPYGVPSEGLKKHVEKFKVENVKAHYELQVREKRIIVFASGDAERRDLEQFAANLARARPGGVLPAKLPAPKAHKSRKFRIIDKPGRNQTQIMIAQIGLAAGASDYDAAYLANHSFGGPGSFSSRMMKEIRAERGWSYGAASFFRLSTQPQSWQMSFFPATKDTPAALAYALKMSERFAESGITEDELQFSKQSLINSAGFSYNTPAKRLELKLTERILNLPEGYFREQAKRLDGLTLSQVNEAVRRVIQPTQLVTVIVGTASEIRAPLAAALKIDPNTIEVVPYDSE